MVNVEFTYKNGKIYGKNDEDTTYIAKCAEYFDSDAVVVKDEKLRLAAQFDIKYLSGVIKLYKDKRIAHLKKMAIEEWKQLNNIAIPNTQYTTLMNVLEKMDSSKVGISFYGGNLIEVSMPFATHTILLTGQYIQRMSSDIELYDGDERIADSAEIILKPNGELDIEID